MKKLCKESIIVNYSDSLEDLASNTINLLTNKIEQYKELFNAEENDIIQVNYFDDLEEFREFIYKMRGERESLPKYARGTYDNGMINAFVDSEHQMNRLYTASHELFHILYMKYILKNKHENRIVWYDEGMAQFCSDEKNKLDQEDNFKSFFYKVKENTKVIPNLNSLKHGDSFCNENYNGYDLSFLVIKYLSENLTWDEFKNLMSDFEKIKLIGNNVLNEMFEYYDRKILNKRDVGINEKYNNKKS